MGKRKRNNRSGAASREHNTNRTNNAPATMAGRRQVSYEDIDNAPASTSAPEPKRRQISYASSDEDNAPTSEPRQPIPDNSPKKRNDSSRVQQRVDPNYGQMSALPLGDYDDEPFYGPANDGMDYLRMVRSEARQVPHVVTAPRNAQPTESYEGQEEEEEGHEGYEDYGHGYYDEDEDEQGYYSDGAYVARPAFPEGGAEGPRRSRDPQETYYTALLARYHAHRTALAKPPLAGAVDALDQHHPISFPHRNKQAAKHWRQALVETTPSPVQLASMDNEAVLRLLELAQGKLQLSGNKRENLNGNLSLWFWGLLGRLGDPGVLNNSDIGLVRGIAKTADWVGLRYRKMAAAQDGGVDEEEEGNDGDEEERAGNKSSEDEAHEEEERQRNTSSEDEAPRPRRPAKPRQGPSVTASAAGAANEDDVFTSLAEALASDAPPTAIGPRAPEQEETSGGNEAVPNANSVATLDMIITVAGEFYGQRDLLAKRTRWI